MTTVAVPSSVVYDGAGTTAVFAVENGGIPIPFIVNSDIKARTYIAATGVETALTEGTDYILTPMNVLAAGVVTLSAGNLATGVKLEIYRDEAIAQDASFVQGTSFPAVTVEFALDKQCRISQQIADQAARGISISRFDSFPAANLELPLDRVNGVIAFDAAGNVEILKPDDFPAGIAGAPCSVNWVIDGGGFPIAAGYSGEVQVPFGMTVTGWTVIGDAAGTCVIDIWRSTQATFPPASAASSITGSQQPFISSEQLRVSSSLPSWLTSIGAGDILSFIVTSSAVVGRVTIALQGTRT
jgi:hypothetical protein